MLYELIYTSLATKQLTTEDLKGLMSSSRRSNRKRGITGLLYYSNREIIQLLEGKKNEVLNLYDRISKDRRHMLVKIFWQGSIEGPAFSSWSMGYIDSRTTDLSKTKGLIPLSEKGLFETLGTSQRTVGKNLMLTLRDSFLKLGESKSEQSEAQTSTSKSWA